MSTAAMHAPTGEFMGHPKGVFFLAFTEAWERFSYYGMVALLVLYMIGQVLLPGHVEHVGGFAAFRSAVESVTGPLSTQALASVIFGLYSGFVYFTPLVGGIVADRWIGQRIAVVIGATTMSAGHLAMAFDRSFLLALVLLAVGSGLLKGNISAQVGALYPADDEARRSRGFVIFSTGINVGAVVGPLFCGALAQQFGWHAGFGAAAIFMLAGLATYLYGYRYLPARVERRQRDATRLTARDWRTIGALAVVMLISIFQSISYYQIANVLPVWISGHVNLAVGQYSIPVPWYQSIDSFFSILGVPLLFWLWHRQAQRGGEPNALGKIGTGALISSAGNLLLVVVILATGGDGVSPMWPFLACAIQGIAFLYYWPTLLALVSRAAPASINATMMGLTFMTLFVSNNLIGWLGRFYEPLGPLQFWGLHAAIGATGALLTWVLGGMLSEVLDGRTDQPLRPSARTLEVER